MSDGTHGHGCTLVGATAGTIGNIVSVEMGGEVRDPIDISTMDSTSKFREFIGGMADPGEITAQVNYDGSASGVMQNLHVQYAAGLAETWTFNLADTSKFVAQGFITNLGVAAPYEDKITQSLTIKLTGVPVYTDVA